MHYRSNKSSAIELPGIAQMKQQAGILMSPYDPARPRHLLPSILSKSPPGRSSTLPPIQRRDKLTRPRKSSVTQNARKPQHDRKSSRGEHVRRMSYEGRKAFSAEPSGVAPTMGKRWEDLIDAATSATEDVDGDRTPVRPPPFPPPGLRRAGDAMVVESSWLTLRCVILFGLFVDVAQVPPHSPPNPHRASLPPFSTAFPHSYQASPLQNTLTPPPAQQQQQAALPPTLPAPPAASYAPEATLLPSVEGSETLQLEARSNAALLLLDDSSPPTSSAQNVQIYCAACQNSTFLRAAYACTECICGICRECVDALMAKHRARSGCPRCGTVGGRFKPFQLDLR